MNNKKKLSTIIVDDEKDAQFILKELLNNIDEVEIVGIADNGIDGLYLINKLNPDIAFIDINMPGKNGIEILKEIHNINFHTKAIITTAHQEYAFEAINYHPFSYLLKPFSIDDIKNILCQIHTYDASRSKNNSLRAHEKLKIISNQEIRFLDYDSVVFLSADGNYTDIKLTDNTIIKVTQQLGKIEKTLPTNLFRRINRAEIINTMYLQSIKRKQKKVFLSYKNSNLALKISTQNLTKVCHCID